MAYSVHNFIIVPQISLRSSAKLNLTPCVRKVARQVGLGQSNKEIARRLVPACSPRSVEIHRASLFTKLDLANDNELGRWLKRHAWLG